VSEVLRVIGRLLPGAYMLMYASRAAAAKQLGASDKVVGLYATAEKLFSHTDAWTAKSRRFRCTTQATGLQRRK